MGSRILRAMGAHVEVEFGKTVYKNKLLDSVTYTSLLYVFHSIFIVIQICKGIVWTLSMFLVLHIM
jgi:hypothetical protein